MDQVGWNPLFELIKRYPSHDDVLIGDKRRWLKSLKLSFGWFFLLQWLDKNFMMSDSMFECKSLRFSFDLVGLAG